MARRAICHGIGKGKKKNIERDCELLRRFVLWLNFRNVVVKIKEPYWSNFQLSIESNPGLLWFYFTLYCDWSTILAPSSQPIRCKTKNNRVRSPAFSRASSSLSSHWLMTMQTLVLIGRLDTSGFGLFNIQLKTKELALLVTQLLSL